MYEAMHRRKEAMAEVLGKKPAREAASRKGNLNKNAQEVQRQGSRKLSHRPGQGGTFSPTGRTLRRKLEGIGARLTPAYSRRPVVVPKS